MGYRLLVSCKDDFIDNFFYRFVVSLHLISSHHIIIINIGSLFWSLLVICKEDGPNDNQNKRDGAAQIVANDHLDDPVSYVPLILVITFSTSKKCQIAAN